MATALPTAEQKLNAALSQWQQWDSDPPLQQAPSVISTLGGGFSNHSWLAGSGGQKFVVRIDGIDPRRLGLSRSVEWRAQGNAFRQGLAPRPVFSNPELGALVTRYHNGTTDNGDNLAAVAQLLQGIHALPDVKFRLRPRDRAAHYLHQLGQSQPPDDFVAACARTETATPCLCHNDLLQANRLRSADTVIAIDWEYAAMGSRWFDLAVICEGDALAPAQVAALLDHYLGRPADPAENAQLADNRLIYRYLSRWWQQLTEL